MNPELAKKHRLVQFYGIAGQVWGGLFWRDLTLLFLLPALFR